MMMGLPELDTAVAWPGTITPGEGLEGSPPRLGGWGQEKLAVIIPRTALRLAEDEPALQRMLHCMALN